MTWRWRVAPGPLKIEAVLHHFRGDGVDPGGFATALLEAMGKADERNFNILAGAFPDYGVPFEIATKEEGGIAALRLALDLERDHAGQPGRYAIPADFPALLLRVLETVPADPSDGGDPDYPDAA